VVLSPSLSFSLRFSFSPLSLPSSYSLPVLLCLLSFILPVVPPLSGPACARDSSRLWVLRDTPARFLPSELSAGHVQPPVLCVYAPPRAAVGLARLANFSASGYSPCATGAQGWTFCGVPTGGGRERSGKVQCLARCLIRASR